MATNYAIIYADPPWDYRNKGVRGAVKNHYPQLTDDDIIHLPVKNIAAQNAALFLWVPYPKIDVGLAVIKSWGFIYKTVAFTWVKYNQNKRTLFMGTGFYTRSNCEICLLGMRGKLTRLSKSVGSVVLAKRRDHSKKPRIIRPRIEQLFGDLPRIELFATETCTGWYSTGFGVDDTDIRDFLQIGCTYNDKEVNTHQFSQPQTY